ncbi:MAG: NERD domain-containing protein [Rhodanobacter thiooxydans]|nr:NERD domain-containing protein [Rhodanobacter thiooxydans]
MIPNQPLDTRSRAELRVFDQLRACFSGADQHDWFAMHSLNLPQHEYKRFGEIDFVVCGPDGLFVLEIKGGSVSCRDGVWETRNRNGSERLTESPFRQAEGALHGLRKKLPAEFATAFVFGYAVVVPDVGDMPESAEWDRAVVADARNFRQFEQWLKKLISHWRNKDRRASKASPDQLRKLQQFLRPEFEAVMPLHASMHAIEARVAQLTEDQLRYIDVVEANDRVICSGGAGTGKTMLALELAKRWSAAGMKVALTCHSPWLRAYLEKAATPGVTVSLTNSAQVTARRAGIEKFDALIVDEGQDVLNMDALVRLDSLLRGGLDSGRWSFFHDVNNQAGLCGEYKPDAYDYLNGLGAARLPLRTNCRNTLPILERVQKALDADVGASAVGNGPAVREITVASREEAAAALQNELLKLMNDEGFDPSDIVILSPNTYSQSCVSLMPEHEEMHVSVLDSYSPRAAGDSAVGFAQIDNFKGLESSVVWLVDLCAPSVNSLLRSYHYVGMTRARALLGMIHVDSH